MKPATLPLLLAEASGPRPSANTLEHTFHWKDSTNNIHNADTGQAATQHTGTWGISGQLAYCSTRTGDSVVTWDTGKTAVDLTCDVFWKTGSSPGLLWRTQDDQNYTLLHITGTTLQVFERVAGTYNGITTTPGTVSLALTNSTWYRFRVVSSGNNYSVYAWARDTASQPATAICTFTASTFAAKTRAGLRINDATAGVRWANLKVA